MCEHVETWKPGKKSVKIEDRFRNVELSENFDWEKKGKQVKQVVKTAGRQVSITDFFAVC